jgi:hypothetical protein
MLVALREMSSPTIVAPTKAEIEEPRPLSPPNVPRTVVDGRVPPASRLTIDKERTPGPRDYSHESLSSVSGMSSAMSDVKSRTEASEAETEEEEGMILVGRPDSERTQQ